MATATVAPSPSTLLAKFDAELNSYVRTAGGKIDASGKITVTPDFSKVSPKALEQTQNRLASMKSTLEQLITDMGNRKKGLSLAKNKALTENRDVQLLVGSQLNKYPNVLQKFSDNAALITAIDIEGREIYKARKAAEAFIDGKLKQVSDAAETIPAPRNYRHLAIQTVSAIALVATGYAVKALRG